jgi:hypothetical protein
MEKHKVRFFENRVHNGIFRPKRPNAGLWRKLRDEELHNLYFSLDNVIVMD